jgi:hypothetical protein
MASTEQLRAQISALADRVSILERRADEHDEALKTPRIRAIVDEHKLEVARRAEESAQRAASVERNKDERAWIDEALEKNGTVIVVEAGERAADHRAVTKSSAARSLGIGVLVGQRWIGFERDWRAIVQRDAGIAELVDLDALRVYPAPSHLARRWLRGLRREGDRA